MKDSIEVAVNGQCMDGVVCVGGCDKNMPGSLMAMARMNVPGIFVYAGTIKPGHWKGQTLTIVSPFEAVGAFSAGKMTQEDFDGIEKNACPTVGACGGEVPGDPPLLAVLGREPAAHQVLLVPEMGRPRIGQNAARACPRPAAGERPPRSVR